MTEILSVREARQAESIGKTVLLRGWVRTRRDSKAGFSFIELNDGSCFGNIQILAPNSLANYDSVVLQLTSGCSVAVTGLVKESPGQGQATEVEAAAVELLGTADAETYPLQKKRHSFEFLRTIAHLRPRTNTFGAVARVRNQVCYSIHRFFQEEGFLYVHTPVITASDCEGAGEMFRVTTLDIDHPPRTPVPPAQPVLLAGVPAVPPAQQPVPPAQQQDGKIDDTKDFFERRAYLTVSGLLEGETYACGLGRIYTFGPTFRAENSNTARHLAEFWMVEPEAAFFELPDNMDLAERFLKRIFRDVMEHCPEDMQFFNSQIDKTILETLTGICDSSFERLPYTEAIDILLKSGEKFDYPVQWGMDLQSEHERYLVERHFNKPVILFDYPRTIKPFYMKVNDDEKTVRAMDVLVPKVGEIIGGSQREERLDVLLTRMKEQDLNADDYWWYVDLRRYGTVPHAGFGLGLERAVQFVTGMANIRDVIPFPRTPGSCEF
ncbi:MAG: asparagine--tRNA ligase [Planctomycetaceae bacterium]|nr:asparagine--tRNA ligase [Planctomycetaceae bacterium]